MIDALIQWSLKNRLAVMALVLLVFLLGGMIVPGMNVDVFPDLTAPTVTVLTECPGLSSQEVESLATFPIESAVISAGGVRRVRSQSYPGVSLVWCEFEWGTDVYRARQVVNELLSHTGYSTHSVERPPTLGPITSIMGEVLFLGLTAGEEVSPLELRALVDRQLEYRLRSVPGVAQVTVIGGGEREYQVELDPQALRAYGVGLSEVLETLEVANQDLVGGYVAGNGVELQVVGRGRFRGIQDIRDTVVRTDGRTPVTVGDLGNVKVGEGPRRGAASVNGRSGMVLGIQKQPDANTIELTRRLDAVLDEIEAGLPAGVELDRHLFRQADFIGTAVHNVRTALRDGAILVAVIMFLFLGHARATFITLLSIPLSLVAALLALHALGGSINTMTLGGLTIAIGALVDDAVIDVENVLRRLRENRALPEPRRRPALRVVLDASIEIRSSIVFATLIVVLVFLPLFFLGGLERRLLQPLALSYVVALMASLGVAVTATPALCLFLLPRGSRALRAREPRLARVLKRWYGVVLVPVVRHPSLVLVPTLAMLVVAAFLARGFGLSFLPDFHEGSLTVNVNTLPGTSLEESDRLGRVVEEILLDQPGVVSVSRRTGRAQGDEHVQGVSESELDVILDPDLKDRDVLLEDLRGALTLLPGATVAIGQPISHRIDHILSGTEASIALKVFGPDRLRLKRMADQVAERARGVPGVVDLKVEQAVEVPVLLVSLDRPAMARHGVPMEEVEHALTVATQGRHVGTIFESIHSYDVVVRLQGLSDQDADGLRGLTLESRDGGKVPLTDVAVVRRDVAPNLIRRENGERMMLVSCNTAGRDVGSVVEELRARLTPLVATEPELRIEYGGQFESARSARRRLLFLSALVVLGVGFLLHLAFQSARDSLLIMVNLPLALIGGVAAIAWQGGVLSVASLVGLITVFGIATRNGIMLLSHVRHLQREEGVTDRWEAVIRGSKERLVPVLMTALATALALVPLIWEGDKAGNEIQAPMAEVILGGLLSSMILNMLVVPALVWRFGGEGRPA